MKTYEVYLDNGKVLGSNVKEVIENFYDHLVSNINFTRGHFLGANIESMSSRINVEMQRNLNGINDLQATLNEFEKLKDDERTIQAFMQGYHMQAHTSPLRIRYIATAEALIEVTRVYYSDIVTLLESEFDVLLSEDITCILEWLAVRYQNYHYNGTSIDDMLESINSKVEKLDGELVRSIINDEC